MHDEGCIESMHEYADIKTLVEMIKSWEKHEARRLSRSSG